MGFFFRNNRYTYNRASQPPRPNYRNSTVTPQNTQMELRDYGPYPFTTHIQNAARQNENFRLALWSGPHLQVTLMSIPVGESIGLENHSNLDQFIRIESGEGMVMMGPTPDQLSYRQNVSPGYAFIIPANAWHNLVNTGNTPLKLYSIYAPPNHPYGTVHPTKADADTAEENHSS